MLVPLSWLKDYVDIDIDAKELEGRLFSSGFVRWTQENMGNSRSAAAPIM